jgi:hypothetical protein
MDYNNIFLKPSWLGIMDWSKGYYNNKSKNILNNILNNNLPNYNLSNNSNDIENVDDNSIIENTENTENTDNKIINNINFDNMLGYYNETKDYIKTNAVFIKPQIQNFYSKEFEQLNNLKKVNTPLIKDEFFDIDEDFSMFNIQRKKKKNTNFMISKIFEDIKDIKKNKNNNNNKNNNSLNETKISNDNINSNIINETYSNSDVSDNDDIYFEPVKSKKNKK